MPAAIISRAKLSVGRCQSDTRSVEGRFPVGADVGQEKVAEDHVLDARRCCLRHRRRHLRFVDLVRARRRDLDDPQRKAQPVGLRLEQRPAHGVHGDAVGVGIHRHQQRRHVDVEVLASSVEGEGAVLAAAPAHPRFGAGWCHLP